MASMMGPNMPDGDEIRELVDRHASVLERMADLLVLIARDDNVDMFEVPAQSQAAGVGQVLIPIMVVPVGKRVLVRRMLTTAPAGSTGFALFANGSGVADGGSLRHVMANAVLGADNLGSDGTTVRGGLQLFAIVQAGAAGICTVRLEGSIMDDGPRTSRTL